VRSHTGASFIRFRSIAHLDGIAARAPLPSASRVLPTVPAAGVSFGGMTFPLSVAVVFDCFYGPDRRRARKD